MVYIVVLGVAWLFELAFFWYLTNIAVEEISN